jgi:hypothetical protein
MRTVRILACLAAVFAASAVAAASAAASPEFDAAKYPVGVTGNTLNQQGFAGTGVASNCKKATANEEGIPKKPEKNQPTLEIHPIYEECILTLLGLTGGKANVVSTGCNFVFHAVKPNEKTATTDVKCASTAQAGEVTEKSKIIKVPSTAGMADYEIVTGSLSCAAPPPKAGCIPTSNEAAKKTWIEKVINATELELSNPVEGIGTATLKSTITVQKDIQIQAAFLPGCVVFIPAQTGLGFVEYKNEPANEARAIAEVENIQTGIASVCGTGKVATVSEYREGKEDAKEEIAELAPKGNPAKVQARGEFGVAKEVDPIEVGINEAHWYKNKGLIPASAEGIKFLMWGAMTFGSTAMTGTCQTLWGGNVINTQGGGPPPGGGSAVAGETQIAGLSAYDCNESTVCETTDASKLFVEPEGLGVVVKESKSELLQWVGPLSGTAPTVNIGNETEGSPTQIKLKLVCPKTTGGEYTKSWVGEQKTRTEEGFVQATSIGSSPSVLRFGKGSGELKVVGTVEKGTVTATNMKMMGYEGGEEITTKNP